MAPTSFRSDDHWFFSVERADPKPALLVHGDNDPASPLYVRTAIESATDAAFTLQSLTPGQAATTNVAKFAFVILSDPGPLPQRLEEALEKYVQAGGSMLVALGRNATPGRSVPVADIPVMPSALSRATTKPFRAQPGLTPHIPLLAKGRTGIAWSFFNM